MVSVHLSARVGAPWGVAARVCPPPWVTGHSPLPGLMALLWAAHC